MAKPKLIESTEEYVAVLERSQLFAPNQLEAIKKLAETAEEPLAIARALVKNSWLTKWQASQLLSGFSNLTLGKYRLADHLGKGELGNVYLADNPKLNRKVALKTLSMKNTESPDLVKRFLNEARAAAALDHRNIIHIHDVSSEGQRHYVVMEYVSGRDLQTRVETDGPLSFAEAASVIRQTAEGLQFAHEQGVVHRDIKPGNIMLDDQGVVKILDIGVGHLRQSPSNPSDSTGELMMSAIAYMSPEHARGQDVDARSDIYSLGGVLYYLLTARAPFSTKTDAERAKIKESKRPLPIADLRADTPPALVELCNRMMALKPEDRIASMADVLAALATADNLAASGASGGAASGGAEAELAEAEPMEIEEAEPEVEAVAEAADEKKTAKVEIKIGPAKPEPAKEEPAKEEPTEKPVAPAIKIDVGDASKSGAAVAPMDFAINTKKRKKKPSAKPAPAAQAAAEKPAAEKTSAAAAAEAGDTAAADDKPEPASAAPKKGLSKRLIIGGACAAGLLLITGVGVGAMMLLGGKDTEVAQAPAGAAENAEGTAKTEDASTDTTAAGEAEAADASAAPANPDGAPVAAAEAAADPFAGGAEAAAPSADATEPAASTGDVTATEPAAAATPTDAAQPPAETVTTKKEPVPDSPAPEKPAEEKPAETKPAEEKPATEEKPAPEKAPVEKAPPKKDTFKFAAAVDLPTPAADAPELTLGQINIRPEDAVFISLDGGDIAIGGKIEFSIQNAQDGVAPRDWEFYLSDGTSDPIVIATMSMPEKDLKFKWTQAGVDHQAATNLRNCSIKITAGQDKPQDVALRTPQKAAPVTIDVEKPATAKLTLEGAPDRSSLKMEVTVKGHKASVEPAQMELGKGGEAIIYFGENQEQAAFALKLEASINARGIQIKTDPHFLIPGIPPVRLNKGSIKKYEAVQAQQAGLQSRVFEGQKAIDQNKVPPQQKPQALAILAEWKQQLEIIDKTVAKMAQLSTDTAAIGSGATLQFRVFSDTFEKQIDLIVPDANAAPAAP